MEIMSPKVPSSSYPGLTALKGVLREASGLTTDQIASKLGIRPWRVKSAISGLKRMKLVKSERVGRRIVYFGVNRPILKAFTATFFQYLLPFFRGRTTKWAMSSLWPADKKGTSYKRATYLIKLSKDLEVLISDNNLYLLSPSGLKIVLTKAVESIYIEESKGKIGSYVNLTRILTRLKEWGMDPKIAKEMLLVVISELGGRLSSSPALSDVVKRDGIRDKRRGYLYYLSLRKG